MKKTKQNVLDLNYIKAKPKGIRLAPLPIDQLDQCPHAWVEAHHLHEVQCSHCGETKALRN